MAGDGLAVGDRAWGKGPGLPTVRAARPTELATFAEDEPVNETAAA